MIGWLSGTLLRKNLPWIMLNVNGVGYELSVPMTSGYKLPECNESVSLFTHLVVREDAHQLYGFIDEDNRDLFRELIKVNGIGPKMGLAILSGMDGVTLQQCVLDSDVAMLTQIPGIGKKTAERLLVELQDRLGKLSLSGSGSTGSSVKGQSIPQNVKNDAVSALSALGYKGAEAKRMIDAVYDDALDSEELIRQALQAAVRKR